MATQETPVEALGEAAARTELAALAVEIARHDAPTMSATHQK